MARIAEDKIAIYDDSWQTKVEWELQNIVFGIKTKVPVPFTRALRHELFLVVDGPDNVGDGVKNCISQAAGAGLIAAIASAYVGAGIGAIEAGKAAFIASVTACLGDLANQVTVTLDDRSHWTDWGRTW